MPDNAQSPENTPAMECALVLYPELAHYFSVFDPAEFIIYPLPAQRESAARDSFGKNGLSLVAAALIPLLIAVAIIVIFVLTGITAVPELSSG